MVPFIIGAAIVLALVLHSFVAMTILAIFCYISVLAFRSQV